jgi:hypothetical protein
MIKSILLFSVFLSTHLHAQSTSNTAYDRLNMHEKKDYDFVVETCHMDIESIATIAESTKKDSYEYFDMLFPDTSAVPTNDSLLTRKGLGKNTNRLLNSYGYYLGLKACFPKSENQRHLYTINLLLLDSFGKAAAISIITVSGAGIYKGLSFLGRRLFIAPTVLLFRKLNASEEFLTKLPKYMGRGGVYTLDALALASLAGYTYKLKKDLDIKTAIAETDDPAVLRQTLQTNLDLYNSSLHLKSQAKTPQDLATINALIKEQRKLVLYYIDSLLATGHLNPQERERLLTLRKNFT